MKDRDRKAAEERGQWEIVMRSKANQALFGYAMVDLFTSPQPTFGMYNRRSINQPQVKKRLEAFNSAGVQRFLSTNAIPIVLGREMFVSQSVTKDDNAGVNTPRLEWTEDALAIGSYVALGGQHCREALRIWRADDEKIVKKADKKVAKIIDQTGGKETKKLRLVKDAAYAAKEQLDERTIWIVAIYDEGKSFCDL